MLPGQDRRAAAAVSEKPLDRNKFTTQIRDNWSGTVFNLIQFNHKSTDCGYHRPQERETDEFLIPMNLSSRTGNDE